MTKKTGDENNNIKLNGNSSDNKTAMSNESFSNNKDTSPKHTPEEAAWNLMDGKSFKGSKGKDTDIKELAGLIGKEMKKNNVTFKEDVAKEDNMFKSDAPKQDGKDSGITR